MGLPELGIPDFVDYPREPLLPLRNEWGVGWEDVGAGEGKGGRTGVGTKNEEKI